MKKLLLTVVALLAITAAHAQPRYTVTTQTGQTYTPLTSGTVLSASAGWDDEDYGAPLSFNFSMSGQIADSFHLYQNAIDGVFILASQYAGPVPVNGFVLLEADLASRSGSLGPSPIRYTVSGSAGSRILKAELANAGFYALGTSNFINLQVWMYEGSNVFEVRYGPSSITSSSFSSYFDYGSTGPLVGPFRNVDIFSGTGKIYNLAGSTTAPVLDSVLIGDDNGSNNVLNGYPPNGTVYRFTPSGTTGVALEEAVATARALKLYPTAATSTITVEWAGAPGEAYEIISASGQQVSTGHLQRGTQAIRVSDLATGTYYLRLEAGSHAFIKNQ